MNKRNLKLRAKALMLSSIVLVPLAACDDTYDNEVAYVDSIESTNSKTGTEGVSEYLTDVNNDATDGYVADDYVEDNEPVYTDAVLVTDSSNVFEVTTGKVDETTTETTLTATKASTNKGTTKSDTYITNGKNGGGSITPSTTKKSVVVTTVTTKKSGSTTTKTTTKSTEKTTKTTEKTTKTTTKTTTKATTTTPETTTTELITEPPVVSYNINDICYNADAFNHFAELLTVDLRNASNGVTYMDINTLYGPTSAYNEAKYILALLNSGSISADVLSTCLSGLSGNFMSYWEFIDFIPNYQLSMGRTFDFSAYCCDNCKYVGNYINSIQNNYYCNTYSNFATDQITNNNINPQLSGNIAVKTFFGAYDSGYGIYPCNDAEYDIGDYIYNLSTIVNGRSYSY